MASLNHTCPGCERKMALHESLAGKPVRCKNCGEVSTPPGGEPKTRQAIQMPSVRKSPAAQKKVESARPSVKSDKYFPLGYEHIGKHYSSSGAVSNLTHPPGPGTKRINTYEPEEYDYGFYPNTEHPYGVGDQLAPVGTHAILGKVEDDQRQDLAREFDSVSPPNGNGIVRALQTGDTVVHTPFWNRRGYGFIVGPGEHEEPRPGPVYQSESAIHQIVTDPQGNVSKHDLPPELAGQFGNHIPSEQARHGATEYGKRRHTAAVREGNLLGKFHISKEAIHFLRALDEATHQAEQDYKKTKEYKVDEAPAQIFADWLEEHATSQIQFGLSQYLRGGNEWGHPPSSEDVLRWLIEHSHLINDEKTRIWNEHRAREARDLENEGVYEEIPDDQEENE